MRKYGREAFDLIVLETHETKDAAKLAEVRLIKEHRTHIRHGGYNSTSGGEGTSDLAPEAEARRIANMTATHARPEVSARRNAAVSAAMADPEVKARHRAGLKAVRTRPGFAARHSAATAAGLADPEVKTRMSTGQRAAHARPEVKASRRASMIEALASPEARARMSIAAASSWPSERRAKQSAVAKAVNARRWATRLAGDQTPRVSPEYSAHMSAAQKALWTPERRVQHSAAQKAAWSRRRAHLAAEKAAQELPTLRPILPTYARQVTTSFKMLSRSEKLYPKFTMAQIAAKLGCGETTVFKYLRRQRIKAVKKPRLPRSQEHRQNLSLAQEGKRRPKRGKTFTCPTCGQPFYVIPARLRIAKYCSYACRAAGVQKTWLGNAHPRYKPEAIRTKVCEGCGVEIRHEPPKPITSFVLQKFCTKSCADEHGLRLKGEAHPRYKGEAARQNCSPASKR